MLFKSLIRKKYLLENRTGMEHVCSYSSEEELGIQKKVL
jgi:hypothetical protein